MAKLTTKERKALPKSDYALPELRAYPIEDKDHARNAKARASEQYNKGNLTASQKNEIDRRADKVINKK